MNREKTAPGEGKEQKQSASRERDFAGRRNPTFSAYDPLQSGDVRRRSRNESSPYSGRRNPGILPSSGQSGKKVEKQRPKV